MVDVVIESITFSDGNRVEFPSSGVTLLVGPNNSGKSQTLRDIKGLARDFRNYRGRALKEVRAVMSIDDFDEWVDRRFPEIYENGTALRDVPGWARVPADQVRGQLNPSNGLGVLSDAFIVLADGQSRLSAGDSQPSIDSTVNVPNHPVQKCYYDSDLEDLISSAAAKAFGSKIVTDRFSGPTVTLRLGTERPVLNSTDGRPNKTYLDALKSMPKLEDQGDGVRSYVGLLLHIIAGDHDVMLVDEPEAFLHPPQARLLGRAIADQARGKQAFIATHSADFLQGVMTSSSSTTIIRITRSNLDHPINHPAVLDGEAIKTLWSDPLLRHSNILDGLFHDAVILCEADTDCRYYSAVLEFVQTEQAAQADGTINRAPDLLFTHCGGKDRMPMVAKALGSAQVPVVVVADFDILRDRAKLKKLVESKGGVFESIEREWRIVSAHLDSKVDRLNKSSLRDALTAAIDEIESEHVDRDTANRLKSHLKPNDGWSRAKEAGLASLGGGDPTNACLELMESLANMGVLVVPVGELEGFEGRAGGHGAAWVANVFENDFHKTPGRGAVEFVTRILEVATSASELVNSAPAEGS